MILLDKYDNSYIQVSGRMIRTIGGYILESSKFNKTFEIYSYDILNEKDFLKEYNYNLSNCEGKWVELNGVVRNPNKAWAQLISVTFIKILDSPIKITMDQAIEIAKNQGLNRGELEDNLRCKDTDIWTGYGLGLNEDYAWYVGKLGQGNVLYVLVGINSGRVLSVGVAK